MIATLGLIVVCVSLGIGIGVVLTLAALWKRGILTREDFDV